MRRSSFLWPADHTCDWLEQRYPVLFHQCNVIFGRRRAAQIVFGLHFRKWP